MTEVLVQNGILESYARGVGVQLVEAGEAPLGTSAAHVFGETLEVEDSSLDYVIAESGPLLRAGATSAVRRAIADWGRALKNGGQLVVLAQADEDLAAIPTLLAYEAGIFQVERKPQPSGEVVTIFTRDWAKGLRRHFARILDEVNAPARSENWRSELRFDTASLLLQADEGALAAEFYRKVLAEDSDSTDARVGLALSLALTSDWDEARSILTEVLEVNPDHGLAAAWLQRAHAQAQGASSDPSVLEPVARRTR